MTPQERRRRLEEIERRLAIGRGSGRVHLVLLDADGEVDGWLGEPPPDPAAEGLHVLGIQFIKPGQAPQPAGDEVLETPPRPGLASVP